MKWACAFVADQTLTLGLWNDWRNSKKGFTSCTSCNHYKNNLWMILRPLWKPYFDSLTHSHTYSLTHSPTPSLPSSLIPHSLTHSLTHSTTHTPTHSCTHAHTQPVTHTRTNSFMNIPIHPLIHSMLITTFLHVGFLYSYILSKCFKEYELGIS